MKPGIDVVRREAAPTMARCLCGGSYSIGYDEHGDRAPTAWHSLPFCDRFRAVTTTNDATAFAEENRQQGGPS